MHRIFVLAAALAFAISVLVSVLGDSAFAAKGDPRYCTMDGCIANCGASGGQPRKCSAYCSKKIPERKAEGKC